jgi:drug/metabolite transporter (DMT)-like permease
VLLPLVVAGRRQGVPTSRPGPSLLTIGVVAGLLIFGGSTLQQWGLVWTTAGKAGFITGLYVVLVPLLGLFWGQRTGRGPWLGVVLAAGGLYLLSARGLTGIAPGDGLVLLSALFWAGHVQWVGRWAGVVAPLELAAIQFTVCSLLSLVGAAVFESGTNWAAVREATWPILYAGVFSVGGAYTLQVLAQRHARPAPAAVILSLESVFAALGGAMLLGETLPWKGWLGCALMLAGVLVAQLGPARRPEPGQR